MKYYQIEYKINKNNEHAYPAGVKNTVWNITQYHFQDKIMIAGTEEKVKAVGEGVVELSEKEALALIGKFKESFPKIEEDKTPVPFKR